MKATREHPNSGPRMVKINVNKTMEEVEKVLRDEFFPLKKSPIGSDKKFTFSVGNYKGEVIENSQTLEDYVQSISSKPRLYLLSKRVFIFKLQYLLK